MSCGATMSELWRDIDRLKRTPHMNWPSCLCSTCGAWRVVWALESAMAKLDKIRDTHWCTRLPVECPVCAALRGDE